jgi:hypothetical protein
MQQPTKSGSVVMGVIDDGIAFAQQRFRTMVGGTVQSRVEYWWLQDGVYQGQPLPFGREFDNIAINNLLTLCTHAGAVDEEELYRRAGLTDFQGRGHKSAAWRVAHGTHVMDQACGYEQEASRGDRPIVCVQLPIRVTADTSGAHLLPYVHFAIVYILQRALEIAKKAGRQSLPVVINLSYGIFAGPHDGTSPIEQMFEKIIALAAGLGVELRLVLPAGNSFLSRAHSQARKEMFVEDESGVPRLSLNWRVPPDCRAPSFLEIWLPNRAGAGRAPPRLKVTITSPTGVSRQLTEGSTPAAVDWLTPDNIIYGQMSFFDRAPPTYRSVFRVSLRATTHIDPSPTRPDAPAGRWTVTLDDIGLAPGDVVDLWVQRDDTLYGFPPRGRQSYFDVRSYRRFDQEGRAKQTDNSGCPVLRAGTLNAIATGPSPIVMGGFLRKEKLPADYSSAGPISAALGAPPSNNDGVTAMAPSEDSRILTGVLGAGSRSGSVVALDGTSVAAPRTARFVAEQLAAGAPGDRGDVKAQAAPEPYPTSREGAGMIDFKPVVKRRRL